MSDKPAKLTKPQAVSADGRRLVENLISRIRNLKDHAQAEQDLSAYIAGLEAAESARPRPADINVIGPVDGMNEKHSDGSYFRLVAMQGDRRHQYLFSRGAAEALRDEMIGALHSGPASLGLSECIGIARKGFEAWAAKDHNRRWFRKIDGTPITNDLPVNIAQAFVEALYNLRSPSGLNRLINTARVYLKAVDAREAFDDGPLPRGTEINDLLTRTEDLINAVDRARNDLNAALDYAQDTQRIVLRPMSQAPSGKFLTRWRGCADWCLTWWEEDLLFDERPDGWPAPRSGFRNVGDECIPRNQQDCLGWVPLPLMADR